MLSYWCSCSELQQRAWKAVKNIERNVYNPMIQASFPKNKQAVLWRAKPSENTWNLLNTFVQCYSSTSLIAAAAATKAFQYDVEERWPMQIYGGKRPLLWEREKTLLQCGLMHEYFFDFSAFHSHYQWHSGCCGTNI